MTDLELTTTRRRTQTVADVVVAELFRLSRRGGIRVGLIVSTCIGLVGGVAVLITLLALASESSHVVVTSPIELCAFLVTVGATLVIAAQVGRDGGGQIGVALALVPRRGRLHVGRAIAAILWSISATVTACVAVALLCLWLNEAWRFSGVALLGLACAVLASAWLALLAFGIGTLVRSSPAAVFILLVVLILLPLGVGVVGGFAPAVAPFAEFVATVTPGQLLLDALAVSVMPDQGLGRVAGGQLGLAAWGIITSASAGVLFHRRDARQS